MIFRVTRPFRFNGKVVMPGQTISEPDLIRAGRLRSMGLVGMVGPERAVKPPAERRTRKPRSKK